jgi:hypothetical protein
VVTNKKPTADFSATRGHSNRRCTAALRRHPPIQAASAAPALVLVRMMLPAVEPAAVPPILTAQKGPGGALAGTRGVPLGRVKVDKKMQRAAEAEIAAGKEAVRKYAERVKQMKRLVATEVTGDERRAVRWGARRTFEIVVPKEMMPTASERTDMLEAQVKESGALCELLRWRAPSALGVPKDAILIVYTEARVVMAVLVDWVLDDSDTDGYDALIGAHKDYANAWPFGCEVRTASSHAACQW